VVLDCVNGQIAMRLEAELAQDVRSMGFGGSFCHHQLIDDLLPGPAVGDELEYFYLPFGELVEPTRRRFGWRPEREGWSE
jgi:hypothetical protein